jgi:hypothetical protein
MDVKRLVCSALAASLLVACAGAQLPETSPSVLAGGERTAAAEHRAKKAAVAFRFKLHRKRPSRAKYVSPGTASILVRVFDAQHVNALATVRQNTTPGSGGCSGISGGTFVCSFAVDVPIGTDTFDVEAFDELNGAGIGLSAETDYPFDVIAGRPNEIPITLGGIPASIQIKLHKPSVFATGDGVSGFQFGGIGPGATQQVQVTAFDADGYVIAAPGLPGLSLTSQDARVSVARVAGSPGVFAVTPLQETTAQPSVFSAIYLTAIATAAIGGAQISGVVAAELEPIVYVKNFDSSISAYAPWSAAPDLAIPGDGLDDQARNLTIDRMGRVYAAYGSGGVVKVFSAGSTTASRTISGLTLPASIVVDANGNIFVAEPDQINEFTAASGNAPSRTIPASSGAPLLLDAAGNLFCAQIDTQSVSVFAPGASSTASYSISSGVIDAVALAFDPAGNLYVANGAYNGQYANVQSYRPPFSSASAVYQTFGRNLFTNPTAVAADANGNVYVSSTDRSDVEEFVPSDPAVTFRELQGSNGSGGWVTLDSLGYVYAIPDGNQYGPVYTWPPGVGTTPFTPSTIGFYDPRIVVVWP